MQASLLFGGCMSTRVVHLPLRDEFAALLRLDIAVAFDWRQSIQYVTD